MPEATGRLGVTTLLAVGHSAFPCPACESLRQYQLADPGKPPPTALPSKPACRSDGVSQAESERCADRHLDGKIKNHQRKTNHVERAAGDKGQWMPLKDWREDRIELVRAGIVARPVLRGLAKEGHAAVQKAQYDRWETKPESVLSGHSAIPIEE